MEKPHPISGVVPRPERFVSQRGRSNPKQVWRIKQAGYSLLALALLLFPCTGLTAERVPKVLVIGIDGLRPDALERSDAPNLDALIKKGAYSPMTQILSSHFAKADTCSGPGWSSILTGVWADKHGVLDNEFHDSRYETYPSFFRRLKQARPSTVSVSIANWPPINANIVGSADANCITPQLDSEGVKEAIKHLADDSLTVMFLYFGDVDTTGHKSGFHPDVAEYRQAIERTDTSIGEVLSAVRNRKTYSHEDWLTIVCSDHGGRGTDHSYGVDVPEIRNTVLIVSGDRVTPGKITKPAYLVDVVPTVLAHLEFPVDVHWQLDGNAIQLNP